MPVAETLEYLRIEVMPVAEILENHRIEVMFFDNAITKLKLHPLVKKISDLKVALFYSWDLRTEVRPFDYRDIKYLESHPDFSIKSSPNNSTDPHIFREVLQLPQASVSALKTLDM